MNGDNPLAVLDKQKAAIDLFQTPGEAAQFANLAEAARKYAKKARLGLDVQNHAAELKIRAERKAGELLIAMKENGQRHPGGNFESHDAIQIPKLSDLGILPDQSSRYQVLARMSIEDFEQYMADVVAKRHELTSSLMCQVVRRIEKAQIHQARKEEIIASYDKVDHWRGEVKINSIQVANIYELALPAQIANLIFTDPPYHDEYIDLYDRLGEVAKDALMPGGYCLAYAGKMFLPEIIAALSKHLEYVSIFAVFQPFSQARITKHNIFENWRPILAFKKPGQTATKEWTQDVVRAHRDKEYHDWQQDCNAPLQYIAAYTQPGDLVLDPFAGGGTTPWACKQIGRYFLAFDVDAEAVALAMERLHASE